MRKLTPALCAVPVLIATTLAGAAEQSQPAPAAWEFGVEQRTRNENWNNLFDFNGAANDEREQIRSRTRLWAKIALGASVEFNVGLNSETCYKFGQPSQWDEAAFDIANVAIRRLGLKGLSLKVGRQDLMKGEGLILFEGTPWDGSRSMYLNAADLAYAFRKSTIEAIGILDPRADRFLPRLNDQRKPLVDWDEQALGLYYTDNNLARTTIEAYYFHKKEIHDPRAPSNPQFQPDRRVETAGARVKRALSSHWTATAEAAEQRGAQHPSKPIAAWAAYGYVTRAFDRRLKPYVTLGYWALSGDDPARPDRISGWDPLFARWPRWGDLELYAEYPEKGIGYATNQARTQVEVGLVPHKGTALKFEYYRLRAFHPFAGKASVYGAGTNRGDNLQARLDFQLNSALKGHVDFETLLPGDFYANRGRAYFLRFEMIATARRSSRALGFKR